MADHEKVSKEFDDLDDARTGIRKLEERGVPAEHISLEGESVRRAEAATPSRERDERVMRQGAKSWLWGGLIGTLVGAVAGLIIGLILGVTPMAVLGTVVAAAFVGGSAGIVIGPELGMRESEVGMKTVELDDDGPARIEVAGDEVDRGTAADALDVPDHERADA